jgi:predicted metal-dependent phosphotriesterase family hydrolase
VNDAGEVLPEVVEIMKMAAAKNGMRVFIRALLAFGINEKEIKIMLHDNPAKLIYLD